MIAIERTAVTIFHFYDIFKAFFKFTLSHLIKHLCSTWNSRRAVITNFFCGGIEVLVLTQKKTAIWQIQALSWVVPCIFWISNNHKSSAKMQSHDIGKKIQTLQNRIGEGNSENRRPSNCKRKYMFCCCCCCCQMDFHTGCSKTF